MLKGKEMIEFKRVISDDVDAVFESDKVTIEDEHGCRITIKITELNNVGRAAEAYNKMEQISDEI